MSVLLPFVATEFYRRLVEGIEGVLLEQRYDLALFPILSLARLKRYLENTTLAYLTDGLILASYDLTERFEEGRLPTERPVVLVDAQNPRYDSVYLDNRLEGSPGPTSPASRGPSSPSPWRRSPTGPSAARSSPNGWRASRRP